MPPGCSEDLAGSRLTDAAVLHPAQCPCAARKIAASGPRVIATATGLDDDGHTADGQDEHGEHGEHSTAGLAVACPDALTHTRTHTYAGLRAPLPRLPVVRPVDPAERRITPPV